ncbi:MAG TPA: acyl-CoA thioesterase [Bacteroidetes bacterium]|nr:acyl-CoA thioesterase [Bacteroidota bacterium]
MTFKKNVRSIEITVRGYHLDLYGHVNNSRYSEFLEEGRWDYGADKIGKGFLEDKGLGMVVVNNNINYRDAAKLHDQIEVKTWIDKVTNRSIIYKHEIYLKSSNTLILDASVVAVVINWKENKAVQIDDSLKAYLFE